MENDGNGELKFIFSWKISFPGFTFQLRGCFCLSGRTTTSSTVFWTGFWTFQVFFLEETRYLKVKTAFFLNINLLISIEFSKEGTRIWVFWPGRLMFGQSLAGCLPRYRLVELIHRSARVPRASFPTRVRRECACSALKWFVCTYGWSNCLTNFFCMKLEHGSFSNLCHFTMVLLEDAWWLDNLTRHG